MSASLKINGSELVPLKDAALAVSYSRDYVSRLAREGKIVASQIGRNWYVDLSSLQNFSITAQAHDALRKVELRSERKNELFVKEKLAHLEASAVARQKFHSRDALVVTCSTLCLGFITGASLYSTQLFSGTTFTDPFTSPVAVLHEESLPVEKHVAQAVAPAEAMPTIVLETTTKQPVFTADVSVRSFSEAAEGIVLFTAADAAAGVATAADFFSDEVSITYVGETEGTVSYEKKSGEVVTYPFVAVPKRIEGALPVIPSTP